MTCGTTSLPSSEINHPESFQSPPYFKGHCFSFLEYRGVNRIETPHAGAAPARGSGSRDSSAVS